VLGNGEQLLVLPIKEVLFGDQFKNKAKVVTYKSKWDSKSEDWAGTLGMACPAVLTAEEQVAVEEVVKKSVKALRVRDYARFDIRLKEGVPFVIDYNANPALGEKDASGLPAKKFGLSYPEFIQSIVSVALQR
jgi:D-alanine-D-alanine ligase